MGSPLEYLGWIIPLDGSVVNSPMVSFISFLSSRVGLVINGQNFKWLINGGLLSRDDPPSISMR